MREIFLFFVSTLVLMSIVGSRAQEKRAAFSGMRGRRSDPMFQDQEKRAAFAGMRGRRSDPIFQDQEKRAAFLGMRGKKAAFLGMRGKKDDWNENDYNAMEGEDEENELNSLRQLVKRQYKAQTLNDYDDLWGKLFQYRKRRVNSGFVGLRG